MAKPTPEPVYHSGDFKVVVTDSFIYEVNLYRIFKDRAECVGSQHYSTEKPIGKFKECETVKTKTCTYMKCVAWIGAPMSYIESNGFKLYDKNGEKGKRKTSRKKR